MKTLKKWMMMAALAALGLTLNGCISFWKGIVEAAVPTIDMAPGIPHYKLLQIKFTETTAIRNKKQSF